MEQKQGLWKAPFFDSLIGLAGVSFRQPFLLL